MKLQMEHVWDAFVLWSLIQQHEVRYDIVKVPHTGDQKHRFTKLMEARNQFVIDNGQDEVAHYCDKCMRTWEDDDGTIHEYFCHADLGPYFFFFGLTCNKANARLLYRMASHLDIPVVGSFAAQLPLRTTRIIFARYTTHCTMYAVL